MVVPFRGSNQHGFNSSFRDRFQNRPPITPTTWTKGELPPGRFSLANDTRLIQLNTAFFRTRKAAYSAVVAAAVGGVINGDSCSGSGTASTASHRREDIALLVWGAKWLNGWTVMMPLSVFPI